MPQGFRRKLCNIFISLYKLKSDRYRKMCSLPIVYVRQHENEETMKINFVFGNTNIPPQNFSFMRSKNELLESALTRMKYKIQSSVAKKSSKKKKQADLHDVPLPPLNIILMKNGFQVEENSKNVDVWTSDTEVIINDASYKIVVNPPTITHLSLPKFIMADFLVYPRVTLEFCSKEDCVFKWYRQIPKDSINNLQNVENVIQIKNICWHFISQGFLYLTRESDIGCKLSVSCIPKFQDKSGEEETVITDNTVVSGPKDCPFNDRHQYTKELTGAGRCEFFLFSLLECILNKCKKTF